jgi:Na+/H+ antiporter NhaD/arsenite permease-like protein
MQIALAEGTNSLSQPPPLWAALPFLVILLAIALLPVLRWTEHWWHSNRNKLLVSLAVALPTLGYYLFRAEGVHGSAPGLPAVLTVLEHSLLDEYFPFLTLLFSLYVISGGILVRGDIRATPATNTLILAIGGLMASFIGTTGASMVLIRPLLKINQERRRVVHTVVFFIFIVSNIGGSLLPIGDPPLFLGYLRGVPFFWTLRLVYEWAFMMAWLLVIYFLWDSWAYRHETARDLLEDRTHIEPIRVLGAHNLIWLAAVVGVVATVNPGHALPLIGRPAPPYLREVLQLALAAVAWTSTPAALRRENQFNFTAIGEVACLFLGIFITMQPPIEILHVVAPHLSEYGLTRPWHFFWGTGLLSSFLDNAPTYVVFFEIANRLTQQPGPHSVMLLDGNFIDEMHLVAISCGAVFMGANTYIGNGPNFMVRSIADHAGVRMPSFFGYFVYSLAILFPLFVLVTLIFLR